MSIAALPHGICALQRNSRFGGTGSADGLLTERVPPLRRGTDCETVTKGSTGMQDRQTAAPPSIYYFHPVLGGEISGWSRHLDRCGAMGFTHLLLAPPFQPGRSGNIFLTSDHDACHPA